MVCWKSTILPRALSPSARSSSKERTSITSAVIPPSAVAMLPPSAVMASGNAGGGGGCAPERSDGERQRGGGGRGDDLGALGAAHPVPDHRLLSVGGDPFLGETPQRPLHRGLGAGRTGEARPDRVGELGKFLVGAGAGERAADDPLGHLRGSVARRRRRCSRGGC